MTKKQFLAGTPFRVKGIHNYKGSSTYYYGNEIIAKQIRSSIDEKVITDSYHLTVSEISKGGFTGFVYVMDKKVEVSYWFEDLVPFISETSVGE
jgi:hypothetical protein